MKLRYVLLAVAVAGTVVAYLLSQNIISLPFSLSGLTERLQPVTTQLQDLWTRWASLPTEMKGILIAGIPTIFTLFFAWSKNRAMQKLQQTQLQAEANLNDLSQQKRLIQNSLVESQQQLTDYKMQVGTNTQTLQSQLIQAQNYAQTLEQDIQSKVATINELNRIITNMKLNTYPVTVIK